MQETSLTEVLENNELVADRRGGLAAGSKAEESDGVHFE